MDDLEKIEAKRQEIETQHELRVMPAIVSAHQALQAMLVTVDELLLLVKEAKMLKGDDGDPTVTENWPEEQDFNLLECVFATYSDSGREFCLPFENISHMTKLGNAIQFNTPNGASFGFTSEQCDIESTWESWLVYCGYNTVAPAEF